MEEVFTNIRVLLSPAMYTLLRKDVHVVKQFIQSQEAYLRFKRAFVEKAQT